MSEEMPQEEIVTTPEVSPEVQSIIDARIAEAEEKYSAQLRGLDRSNSKLQKELSEKSLAGKTIEERTAAIEKELQESRNRAATMEAFGRAGLSEEWRSLFDLKDPEERANTLKDLLEEHTKSIQRAIATQFVRDPETPDDTGLRQYDLKQLEGMDPLEIKQLMKEGRVKGV